MPLLGVVSAYENALNTERFYSSIKFCIYLIFNLNYAEDSPSKVQGVTVTRTVQGSSPALRVSWSAAVSSGRQGSYSDRVQRNACNGKWFVLNCGIDK